MFFFTLKTKPWPFRFVWTGSDRRCMIITPILNFYRGHDFGVFVRISVFKIISNHQYEHDKDRTFLKDERVRYTRDYFISIMYLYRLTYMIFVIYHNCRHYTCVRYDHNKVKMYTKHLRLCFGNTYWSRKYWKLFKTKPVPNNSKCHETYVYVWIFKLYPNIFSLIGYGTRHTFTSKPAVMTRLMTCGH